MLGLQATAAKYGAWLLLSVLCAVSASNVGNMIGLLTPDLNLALPVLAVIATMLLAFAGFMGRWFAVEICCCRCRTYVLCDPLCSLLAGHPCWLEY